jgi:AcrR family transcriptional regulator
MNSKEKIKPRKKAQQFRSRETVKAIVQAASYILLSEGVKGFNTNNIAKRAGVSIGSLYQYFPNKDSISSMLFENFFSDQIEIVTRNISLIKSWEDLEPKILDIVKEIYEYRLSDKMINRQLALEISNGLFNQLMLEKKFELSRSVLTILNEKLGLCDTDENFANINLIVDSVDSMIFNVFEIDYEGSLDANFTFISKMIKCGVGNLEKQTVA